MAGNLVSTVGRIIRTAADLAEGAAWLVQTEPRFAPVMEAVEELPLRLKPPGFAALLDIIASQQVSVASADAIRARMLAAGLVDETAVRQAGEDGLRAAGFSRPKIRYALALCDAGLDYDAMAALEDAEVARVLCQQMGIGPWSAEIYLMFCLGRADVMASGDLALQESARILFDLPARPSAPELAAMAAAWSPWRSVAARALFAYYRINKQLEGLG
ncbi:DNA-3-methyladenine glycosylase II [Sulfitobacter brevis]|uniref:DNA-3-methyladenine glycosylase II n=1 Tax=Sulfitobacter brevis TaxID=74348 RepID=A0A1I1URE4_9RHOB|nr:DNA-3-methyladenine glycosylase [Sulfitobacter brevis]SFD73381.1 DNA-3-methyladenine glycosylase II [Sulfitobacter brevis]